MIWNLKSSMSFLLGVFRYPPFHPPCLVAVLLTISCAALPEGFERSVSYAYIDTQDTRLSQDFREQTAAHSGQSGFLLLANGMDAFVARAVLARAAERSIDAQYYLLHDDLTGKLFIQELLKAADRGVRVRLLVDDMDLAGRDLGAAIVDSHPNIEVRLFNPFSRKRFRFSQLLTGFRAVRRRMHNKSFTVDNQVTIVGGRNIGNEYFEANPDLAYGDLDVLGIGPVVQKVSASFDEYWNNELAYPASVLKGKPPTEKQIEEARKSFEKVTEGPEAATYREALENSELAQKLRSHEVRYQWGEAEVLSDAPEKLLAGYDETEYHLSPQLRPHFEALEDEVIIFSAYFVPGKEGTAFLKQLAERGIAVRILTNSLASNDVPLVHAGYGKYRKDMMQSGIELHEMKRAPDNESPEKSRSFYDSSGASLHAKSFIFDRRKVFVGSLNLDPRAVVHNTEIGILFESRETAEAMAEWFDQNVDSVAFRLKLEEDEAGKEAIRWHENDNGNVKVHGKDPYTSFWRRLGIGFLSILPIESQL